MYIYICSEIPICSELWKLNIQSKHIDERKIVVASRTAGFVRIDGIYGFKTVLTYDQREIRGQLGR